MRGCGCVVWASLIALVTLQGAGASIGDRQPAYRRCVANCVATAGCVQLEPPTQGSCDVKVCDRGVQGAVVAALWGCQDECRYQCMWDSERMAARRHVGAQKYHGKWPFQRVWGLQEIASVVASIANFGAHVEGYLSLRSAHAKAGYKYAFMHLWTAYFTVSCAAWLCSSLFHSRDTMLTERLDYGAANAAIAVGVWASVVRCLVGVHRAWVAGAVCFAGWASHVIYMNAVKFDYGWNMSLCVCVGLAQSGVWARWVMGNTHPGKLKLCLFLATVNLAMLLELLDFPPLWRVVDAHAAWHFATVPLVSLWYSFLWSDVAWEASKQAADDSGCGKRK